MQLRTTVTSCLICRKKAAASSEVNSLDILLQQIHRQGLYGLYTKSQLKNFNAKNAEGSQRRRKVDQICAEYNSLNATTNL